MAELAHGFAEPLREQMREMALGAESAGGGDVFYGTSRGRKKLSHLGETDGLDGFADCSAFNVPVAKLRQARRHLQVCDHVSHGRALACVRRDECLGAIHKLCRRGQEGGRIPFHHSRRMHDDCSALDASVGC